MTLVRNPLQPLSGSKLFFLILFIFFIDVSFVNAQNDSKQLKVGLLVPLNFQNLTNESTIDQKSFEFSNLGIDYYRGLKLAADSLTKEGYSFDIKLFDTQSDTNIIKGLSLDPYLMKADYVIGPFQPVEIQTLIKRNSFLKGKIISPISPLLIQGVKPTDIIMVNNSLENHAQNMAKYFANNKLGSMVLIVRNGLLAETRYSKAFEKNLDSIDKKILHKEILTAQKGYGIIEGSLSKTKENYLVIPSADQAYAINLFKYLESLNNQYSITLLVHPKWLDFQTIDPTLFVKYKITLTSSYYVNYDDPKVLEFVMKYRSSYNSEPTEMSFRGFDQLNFFAKNKFNDKKLFKSYDHFGLASVFNFPNFNKSTANTKVFILKYGEDGLIPQQ